MIGYPTFYKNNSRTITGTVNPVFAEDVILLCDTSLGAVNLTLLEIPADRFSTQYKLYIVDKSNNASVNNITITAPIGFTVNNSGVATINVNGGVGVISISSNLTYNAQFNFGGGGSGNPIIIENEGVVITPNATNIDFVGSLVNATAVGTNVTVTINPNFIVVNYTQLQTLISTNALIPAQQYLVSDAIFINTIGQQEFVPIVVEAVSTNQLEISGAGFFQNADYQGVGNYSGVPSYVANKGTWLTGGIYVVGDVVIYNNLQYVNISGSNTGVPDITPADWTLLTKATLSWINTSTKGYITEIDIIKYNSTTNQITYREDKRFNKVDNNFQTYSGSKEAFYVFQWGNNRVRENIVQNESFLDCINNTRNVSNNAQILCNSIDNNAEITVSNNGSANFDNNSFVNFARVILTNDFQFFQNNFDGSGNWTIINSGGFFAGNNFTTSNGTLTNSGTFNGNSFSFGNFTTLLNSRFFSFNTFFNFPNSTITNAGNFEKNTINYTNNFTVNNVNVGATFNQNTIQNTNTFTINFNQGTFDNNLIDNGNLTLGIISGTFSSNKILTRSVLLYSTSLIGNFQFNLLENASSIEISDLGANINNNTFFDILLQIQFENNAVFRGNTFKFGQIGTSIIDCRVNSTFNNNNFVLDNIIGIDNANLFTSNYFNNCGNVNIVNTALGKIENNICEFSLFRIVQNNGGLSDNRISQKSDFLVNQNDGNILENNFDTTVAVIVNTASTSIRANDFRNSSVNINQNLASASLSGNTFKIGNYTIVNQGVLNENVFVENPSFIINNLLATANLNRNNFLNGNGTIDNNDFFEENTFEDSFYQIVNDGTLSISTIFSKNFFKTLNSACAITNEGIFTQNQLSVIANTTITNRTTGTMNQNVFLNIKTMTIINSSRDFVSNTISNASFVIDNRSLGQFIGNCFDNSTFNCVTNFRTISYNQMNSDSNCNITTNNGQFLGNVFLGSSNMLINTMDNLSVIQNNQLTNTAWVASDFIGASWEGNVNVNCSITISGRILQNIFNNQWQQVALNLTAGLNYNIARTNVCDSTINTTSTLYNIDGGICQDNCGTIIYSLDMLDLAIYNPATFTLTIPTAIGLFCGEYNLINVGLALQIDKIIGLNPRYATKFTVDGLGDTANFRSLNPLALATPDEIVSYIPFPAVNTYSISGRTNGKDSIYIRPLGNVNGIEQVYEYQ